MSPSLPSSSNLVYVVRRDRLGRLILVRVKPGTGPVRRW